MHTSNNDELNQEIIEHLMHPKNYGEITPANGIGMGYDAKTQEFVVFYILVNDSQLDKRVSRYRSTWIHVYRNDQKRYP